MSSTICITNIPQKLARSKLEALIANPSPSEEEISEAKTAMERFYERVSTHDGAYLLMSGRRRHNGEIGLAESKYRLLVPQKEITEYRKGKSTNYALDGFVDECAVAQLEQDPFPPNYPVSAVIDLADRIVYLIKDERPSHDEVDAVRRELKILADSLQCDCDLELVPAQRVTSGGTEADCLAAFCLVKDGTEVKMKEVHRRVRHEGDTFKGKWVKDYTSFFYSIPEFVERCAEAKYMSFSEWTTLQLKEREEKRRFEEENWVDWPI